MSQFYGVAGCFFLFAALLALSTSGGWAVLACIGAALTCFGTAVSYLLPYSLRGMEAASRALVLGGGTGALAGLAGVVAVLAQTVLR